MSFGSSDEPTFVCHMRNLRLIFGLCSYTCFRHEVMSPSPNRNLALTQHRSHICTRGTCQVHFLQLSWVYKGSRSNGMTSQHICTNMVTSEVPGAMPFRLRYDLFWITSPFLILSSPEAHKILLGLWVRGKSLLTSTF